MIVDSHILLKSLAVSMSLRECRVVSGSVNARKILIECLRQVASTLSTTFYALFFLFSGFLQPASGIPPWWIWWVAI